jgi:bifunctional oligoribonuclease and PAP phosphatase NrnA
MMEAEISRIADSLAAFRPLRLPRFGRTRASVLVPLIHHNEELFLLLTRRSPDLSHHAGEISFPGGTPDKSDQDAFATALRETREETGLAPDSFKLLGELDDQPTITGYCIRPYVAITDSMQGLQANDSEVDHMLKVPLKFFIDGGRTLEVQVEQGRMRGGFPLYSYQGQIIWGATARIIADLVGILTARETTPFTQAVRRLMPRIHEADRVILTTHVNPDPDGLGAQVGMEELLLSLGKKVVIANHDPVPKKYNFISFRSPIFIGNEIRAEKIGPADLLLVLDTGVAGRLGQAAGLLSTMNGRVAVLDHHLEGSLKGDPVLVDRSFSSASEIVYELLRTIGFRFTPRVVNALYAGIMFDTDGFRYVGNRSAPFKVAGHLVDMGADALGIQESLFAAVSRGHVGALAKALERAVTEFDGRWMWSYTTVAELDEVEATAHDAGDIAPFFVSIEGVRVSTVLREMPDGRFKASFRSKQDYPIGHICKSMGGGGHANAGGATVSLTPEQFFNQIRAAVEEVVKD